MLGSSHVVFEVHRGFSRRRASILGCTVVVLLGGLLQVAWGEESSSQLPVSDPGLPKMALQSLSENELVQLRDVVAYQISMGRTLEVACRQIERRSPILVGSNSNSPDALITSMYELLTTVPTAPSGKPRAIALIGDRYHHPGYIRPPLEKVCQKVNVPVAFIYDVRLLNSSVLQEYDLLIILRDGMLWPSPSGDDEFGKERVFWLTPEQEMAIAQFVAAGRGFLALHNATALKGLDDQESLYRQVLGATYAGHGKEREEYCVRITDQRHPVAQNVEGYEVIDERHWPKLHVTDAWIFLEAASSDRRSIHGFTRTYGKGRVCYLANGHNREVLESAAMQQLMENAIRWCLARE